MTFWDDFDQLLFLEVDQGHFGQFGMKWHFKCSDARMDYAMSI